MLQKGFKKYRFWCLEVGHSCNKYQELWTWLWSGQWVDPGRLWGGWRKSLDSLEENCKQTHRHWGLLRRTRKEVKSMVREIPMTLENTETAKSRRHHKRFHPTIQLSTEKAKLQSGGRALTTQGRSSAPQLCCAVHLSWPWAQLLSLECDCILARDPGQAASLQCPQEWS